MTPAFILLKNFSFVTFKNLIQRLSGYSFRLHNAMPLQFTKADLKSYKVKLTNIDMCETVSPIYCIQKTAISSKEIAEILARSTSLRMTGQRWGNCGGFGGACCPDGLGWFDRLTWKGADFLISKINAENQDKLKELLAQPSVEYAILDNDIVTLERKNFFDHTSFDIRLSGLGTWKTEENADSCIFIEDLLFVGDTVQFLKDNLESIYYEVEFNCLNIYEMDFLKMHIDFRTEELYVHFDTDRELQEICQLAQEPKYIVPLSSPRSLLTLDTNLAQSGPPDVGLVIKAVKDFMKGLE